MYKPKYRCLMCGKEFYGKPVETQEDARRLLNRTLFRGGQFGAPYAVSIHDCGPDRFGVALLTGYVGGFKKEAEKYGP